MKICIVLMMTGICLPAAAEVFVQYGGNEIPMKYDSTESISYHKTLDSSLFSILESNSLSTASKSIDELVLNQENTVRQNLDGKEFSKIINQLAQTKIGLDYYVSKLKENGITPEIALGQSWDYATSAGVAMGLSREYYSSIVKKAARSKKDYDEFVRMIPNDLDDAILKSKPGWKKDAQRQLILDDLTSQVALEKNDYDVLSSEQLLKDQHFGRVHTTSTLLNLKRSYVLRSLAVQKLRAFGKFPSEDIRKRFFEWWELESKEYDRVFPNWKLLLSNGRDVR